MKLVDNLYAYVWQGSDNNCNSYLLADVLNGGRHLLIDPGHITTPSYREPGLDMLAKNMEADGLSMQAIGLIILTHAHPDHCEAARVIRKQNGAMVALHQADEQMYTMIAQENIDLYLQEGDLVLTGEKPVTLKVYHVPGHSPGHIALYWPEQKVLVAGDVIFYRSTGRVDLPGGSPRGLKQSIESLSELNIEYLLCGHPYGHPGIIKGSEQVRQNFDFIKRNIF
ncbi:MAG: MBL fold metallo-hydrolase [Dehalococcoidia bacterium]|nr:MBL fold metallo-hydrolase [Dehalococcoidia bacterium]